MLPETPAKALIFDMDGTIVDNMRYHDDAWEVWYRKYGLPFERATFSARTAGMAISDIIGPHFPGADAAGSTGSPRRRKGSTARPTARLSRRLAASSTCSTGPAAMPCRWPSAPPRRPRTSR